MRKIDIDFAEDRRWRFVWIMTAILCLGFLIFMGRYSYQIFQEKQEINQQIQNARLLMPGKPIVVDSKPDSRYTGSLKAASLLQFDLNKVFLTIENIAEPSVRLVNMTFDASIGTLRLEYELDSVELAVVLTEKLNSGYEVRPWKLESLSNARANNISGVNPAASKTIGVWSSQINLL